MAHPITTPAPGTLEAIILANLDAESNDHGRPVTDFWLRVDPQPDGVLHLHLWPHGFNSEEVVIGVEGNTLLGWGAVQQLHADVAAKVQADAAAKAAAAVAAAEAEKAAASKDPNVAGGAGAAVLGGPTGGD